MADLGGEEHLSTLERAAVGTVALLDAMAKDVAARWLRGESVRRVCRSNARQRVQPLCCHPGLAQACQGRDARPPRLHEGPRNEVHHVR